MKINILIVDDIEANIISLEYLLKEYFENINILTANNGEGALKIIYKNIIDLIILDIQMPVMDGFETAKLLKKNKKTKDIPIIFLTAAFKSEEFEKKGFSVGAVDYLTKPINDYQLINKIKLYISLFEKTNELLDAQKKIAQQSKMVAMGEMIGNIAHQWRQPLSVISTSATALVMKQELGLLEGDDVITLCNNINKQAQYLSKTIDDFRNFIKGEHNRKKFSLKENIESLLNIVKPSLKSNNIDLVISEFDDIEMFGYPNELNQALINIINNAKDVLINKDDKYIFLDIKKQNNQAVISIKDSGGGIEDDIIDRIFEPYFTTKHKSQGTGLGLSIVYSIVSEMNGSLDVKNSEFEYDNKKLKGAKFNINIPIEILN